MTRAALITLSIVVAAAACARPTSEQQIVTDAAEALGGRDRILTLKTLTIEGEGTQQNFGQDMSPWANGQTYTLRPYRRDIDIEGGRARTELTRTTNFLWFQVPGRAPQPQVEGIDGAVGYNVQAPGSAPVRTSDTVANERRLEMLRHPLTAVRAALDPAATLANARSEGGESLVDVTTADGRMFTLAIDATTKLPTRVVRLGNHDVLGDVALATRFAEYREVSGLQLPWRIMSATDDYVTAEIRVANQTIDGDTGDITAPAAVAAEAPPSAAPGPTAAMAEQLAEGIWRLTGGRGSASVLVEFNDHLTLIDAPRNDAWVFAVIAKARELRPDKRVTKVINTHHHFDHIGGIRAAISEGLTVVTHQGNAGFIEEIAKRSHILVPDALAKNPKPLMIETLKEDTVLTDGRMTVNLYLLDFPHSEAMVFAHFPRERLLVVADLYVNDTKMMPYGRMLLEELKERNLRVGRVVPFHGGVVPFAQVVEETAAYEKLKEEAATQTAATN